MIRQVEKKDIEALAIVYKDLYDNVDIGECWSIEKAKELLMYWYEKQKDLFFVAIEDNTPVGAVMSGVKNWFDGLCLIDTEIFVSNKYQHKNIAKKLMLEHLKTAKFKYNVNMIEFHTYGAEDEFPQNWYKRIGFNKDEELIIMNANVEEVLGKLGYFPTEGEHSNKKISSGETGKSIENFSYDDLTKLYSGLKQGDKAFIFDMVPEYAYLDNEEERAYLESRITAMRNGAQVNLYIVGDATKLNELRTNELFKKTINSCYNNSKIYIIDKEKFREKCLDEFFQLANGLYYGERVSGEKEVFRDLWSDSNNLGLMIREKEVVDFIEKTVKVIDKKVTRGEIKVEKLIEGSKYN